MFTKTQLEKYADVLVWGLLHARREKYKPYDVILLVFEMEGLPLAEIVSRKLIRKKFNVEMKALPTPEMQKDFYTFSDKQQRQFIGSWQKTFMKDLNGQVVISAPSSLTHLKDIDPSRLNEKMLAGKPLHIIRNRNEEKGLFGWTLCEYPTEALAKKAKLSLKEYSHQMIKACFLNHPDPVQKWKDILKNSNKVKKWLNNLPIKTIHLESRSCDIKFSLGEQRQFLGVSGHNIPSFEIFTSPDWRGTEGIYFADFPTYRDGNFIKDIRLEFKQGNIVAAKAGQGNGFLNKMIKRDMGARRVGEFSLTDTRFSNINKFMANTLYDENFGGKNGNSHIAIGSSYSDTFSANPAGLTQQMKKRLGFNNSSLHWDMVNTENKKATAILKDGKRLIIYEKGKFNLRF